MKRSWLALVAVVPLVLSGCPLIPAVGFATSTEATRKEQKEGYWNSVVGKRWDIESAFRSVIVRRQTIEPNVVEYVIRQKPDGCLLAVRANTETNLVTGWRYAVEPSICWAYYTPVD